MMAREQIHLLSEHMRRMHALAASPPGCPLVLSLAGLVLIAPTLVGGAHGLLRVPDRYA